MVNNSWDFCFCPDQTPIKSEKSGLKNFKAKSLHHSFPFLSRSKFICDEDPSTNALCLPASGGSRIRIELTRPHCFAKRCGRERRKVSCAGSRSKKENLKLSIYARLTHPITVVIMPGILKLSIIYILILGT